MTECNAEQLEFHALGRRAVTGRFDGGAISSDDGALLLRERGAKTRIVARMAEQFTDHRDPEATEHSVRELTGQRVLGLALGYEDLNDHDRLRHDPLFAAAVGKRDPEGRERLREQDRGKALASSSTLNRLELTPITCTPTSCGCTSAPSPTCCSVRCAALACRTPSCTPPSARPSARGC